MLILLMGPTASGKTGLSLALAQQLPVEIVSVDSAQVFRGMDVGTAKPDAAQRAAVPHHLLDIRDPAQAYSAAAFRDDALRAIEAIRARGRIPLLAGGTMLYFRALTHGLSDLPSADPALRAQLEAQAAREGWPALHTQLGRIDPPTAARLHPNDGQRIQRALEIHALTGEAPSARYGRGKAAAPAIGDAIRLVLAPPRPVLHERIAQRLEQMHAAGFLDEVAALRGRGDLHADLPSMRAVGYRQLWRHLDGACSLVDARAAALHATRQYAKRQMTWLRDEPGERIDTADAAATAVAAARTVAKITCYTR